MLDNSSRSSGFVFFCFFACLLYMLQLLVQNIQASGLVLASVSILFLYSRLYLFAIHLNSIQFHYSGSIEMANKCSRTCTLTYTCILKRLVFNCENRAGPPTLVSGLEQQIIRKNGKWYCTFGSGYFTPNSLYSLRMALGVNTCTLICILSTYGMWHMYKLEYRVEQYSTEAFWTVSDRLTNAPEHLQTFSKSSFSLTVV